VHLSRKFKEKTGVGLNEYMVIFRLKKAKEFLLTRDKMSICEVAFHCGFNDSNYFSWLFKKTYGVTPSQYRKNTRA
jgi:two-component system response regulator YesN